MQAKLKVTWKKNLKTTIPSLQVLVDQSGEGLGLVYKPADDGESRNAWRAMRGIGDAAVFIGHRWTLAAAKQLVVRSLKF